MLIGIPKMPRILKYMGSFDEYMNDELNSSLLSLYIQGQMPADSMNGFKDFLKLHWFFTQFHEVFSTSINF